jgi:chromosome segregation ATPase
VKTHVCKAATTASLATEHKSMLEELKEKYNSNLDSIYNLYQMVNDENKKLKDENNALNAELETLKSEIISLKVNSTNIDQISNQPEETALDIKKKEQVASVASVVPVIKPRPNNLQYKNTSLRSLKK